VKRKKIETSNQCCAKQMTNTCRFIFCHECYSG